MSINDETVRLGMLLFGLFTIAGIISLVVVVGLGKLSSEGFQTGVPPINGTLNTDNISSIQSVLPVDQLDSMFARIEEMKKEVRMRVSQALPKGIISMWRGNIPPTGWAICDGNNGTPDLRGKFILGVDPSGNIKVNDSNSIDNIDYHNDKISVTLKPGELPEHTHPILGFHKYDGSEAHWHYGFKDGVYRYGSFERSEGNRTTAKYPSSGPTKQDSTEVNNTRTVPVELPKIPYYALAYIMYLGIDSVE